MNAMPVEMWKDLFDARIVLEGSLCAECACSLPTNACHFIGLSCGKEIVFRRHHYLSRGSSCISAMVERSAPRTNGVTIFGRTSLVLQMIRLMLMSQWLKAKKLLVMSLS